MSTILYCKQTEAGLIESAASASVVIRFFQKLNKIPMAKNASLS